MKILNRPTGRYAIRGNTGKPGALITVKQEIRHIITGKTKWESVGVRELVLFGSMLLQVKEGDTIYIGK